MVTLGLIAALAFSAYVAAPASWWEIVDRPVVLECASGSGVKKPISFTPHIGKIIYDGGQVEGTVSGAAISFQFKNINGDHCDWTISRITGGGKSSCKDKDDKYTFGDFSCAVNPRQLF